LEGVIKYAEKQNIPVSLTPGKKQALGRFYKKLGFKANKGRTKDYRFSDTLIHKK
jgi:hypothetical protein